MSSKDSKDADSSVLINGHFDSPLGSPGAGDCGTCVGECFKYLYLLMMCLRHFMLNHLIKLFFFVYYFYDYFAASMLELARLIVDSGWIPPRPIIFLFNGAEELFMLV